MEAQFLVLVILGQKLAFPSWKVKHSCSKNSPILTHSPSALPRKMWMKSSKQSSEFHLDLVGSIWKIFLHPAVLKWKSDSLKSLTFLSCMMTSTEQRGAEIS